MIKNICSILLILTCFPLVSPADAPKKSFAQWKAEFKPKALKYGITKETFADAFKGVKVNKKVIKYDRHQPEIKQTFTTYFEKRVPPRISKGRRLLSTHKKLLDKISHKYKVPIEIIVALWGSESNFGDFTGGFPTIEALATLAHDGRREELFTKELLIALKIIQDKHVKTANMKGSWAGALGQCQFMPSSFEAYAVDENGNSRKDIWHDIEDVFGSIANYLHKSGWNYDQPWGYEIKYSKALESQKDTKKSLINWRKAGIKKISGTELPKKNWEGRLVVPKDSKRAFLLLHNADVLMKWNRSTWFVLSIGLLSDELRKIY